MRPGEVLDAQADLLTRLRDRRFTSYIDTWAQEEMRAGEGTFGPLLANHTRAAHAYRVTHDMSLMVEWMSGQLDGTDQFMRDLAPDGCGFVSFDKPLPIRDIRGKTMLAHFFVWGPALTRQGPATALWVFNDAWRQADEVQADLLARLAADRGQRFVKDAALVMGRWAATGFSAFFDQQRLGPMMLDPSNEQQNAQVVADGLTPVPGTNPLRLLHALWLLLGQTITTVADEDLDRPTRRRLGKAGLPPRVSVVRLRRSEQRGYDPDAGETHVQWQHRWIVKQHWRWQPYGPRKGTEHVHQYGPTVVEAGGLVQRCMVPGCENHLRRIIIPAAVKGPSDRPLIQSEKVYDLAR